jgi:hypothetical protein
MAKMLFDRKLSMDVALARFACVSTVDGLPVTWSTVGHCESSSIGAVCDSFLRSSAFRVRLMPLRDCGKVLSGRAVASIVPGGVYGVPTLYVEVVACADDGTPALVPPDVVLRWLAGNASALAGDAAAECDHTIAAPAGGLHPDAAGLAAACGVRVHAGCSVMTHADPDRADEAASRDVGDAEALRDVGDAAALRDVGDAAALRDVGDAAALRDVCDVAALRDVGDAPGACCGDAAGKLDVGHKAALRHVGLAPGLRAVRGASALRHVDDATAALGDLGEAAALRYVAAALRPVRGASALLDVGGAPGLQDVLDTPGLLDACYATSQRRASDAAAAQGDRGAAPRACGSDAAVALDDEYADMATFYAAPTLPRPHRPPAVPAIATQEMHRCLRRLAWCVHPCGMPAVLSDMAAGAAAAPASASSHDTAADRLAAWASVQLPLVGITPLPKPPAPPPPPPR